MASYWKALRLLFSLPLGASLSALAAAGLQNGAIVSPLQVSCTAKTGPLKEPFTASMGSWLGERGTGTQWPPSPDTQKMEMSYSGAALVSLIAMSGRGDEGRGETMGFQCFPRRGSFPSPPGKMWCFKLWWGWRIALSLPPTLLPSQILEVASTHPHEAGKECASLCSGTPPFLMFAF